MPLREPTSLGHREEHLLRDRRRRLVAAVAVALALLVLWSIRRSLARALAPTFLGPGRCAGLSPADEQACHQALVLPLVESAIVGVAWLALCLFYLPGALSRVALLVWPMATLLLWIKLPPALEPWQYGTSYAGYVAGERTLWSWLATRGSVPWLAAHLGFASRGGWLIFLFVLFLIGVLRLYTGILELTASPVFAFLASLIPATSVTGWYSIVVPGYTDWAIFGALACALFARSDLAATVCCVLALLSHERATAIVALLPFLRALIHPPTERRRFVLFVAATLGLLLLFFVIRGLIAPASPVGMDFYLQEAMRGSFLTTERVTLAHIGEAVWASHGAHLILGGVSLVSLFSTKRALMGKLGLLATCAAVVLQLFPAVDSVRLLDLLVFPIIVSLCSLCRTRQETRTPLAVGMVAAHLFYLASPVAYVSRNWNFQPRARFNLLDI